MSKLSSRFKSLAQVVCDGDETANPIHAQDFRRGVRFKVISRVKQGSGMSYLSCGDEDDDYNIKGDLCGHFKCQRLIYEDTRDNRDNVKTLLAYRRVRPSKNSSVDRSRMSLKTDSIVATKVLKTDSVVAKVRSSESCLNRNCAVKSAFPQPKSIGGGIASTMGNETAVESLHVVASRYCATKSAFPRPKDLPKGTAVESLQAVTSRYCAVKNVFSRPTSVGGTVALTATTRHRRAAANRKRAVKSAIPRPSIDARVVSPEKKYFINADEGRRSQVEPEMAEGSVRSRESVSNMEDSESEINLDAGNHTDALRLRLNLCSTEILSASMSNSPEVNQLKKPGNRLDASCLRSNLLCNEILSTSASIGIVGLTRRRLAIKNVSFDNKNAVQTDSTDDFPGKHQQPFSPSSVSTEGKRVHSPPPDHSRQRSKNFCWSSGSRSISVGWRCNSTSDDETDVDHIRCGGVSSKSCLPRLTKSISVLSYSKDAKAKGNFIEIDGAPGRRALTPTAIAGFGATTTKNDRAILADDAEEENRKQNYRRTVSIVPKSSGLRRDLPPADSAVGSAKHLTFPRIAGFGATTTKNDGAILADDAEKDGKKFRRMVSIMPKSSGLHRDPPAADSVVDSAKHLTKFLSRGGIASLGRLLVWVISEKKFNFSTNTNE